MHSCMVSALLLWADSKEKLPKNIITFLSCSGSRNRAQRLLPICPPHSQSEKAPKINETMASQVRKVNFLSSRTGKKSSGLNTEWAGSPHQGNPSPHTNKKDSWSIYTEVEIYIYRSWSIYRLLRRPSRTQKKLFHFISITSVSNKKICPKVMKNNHQKVWSVSRSHF